MVWLRQHVYGYVYNGRGSLYLKHSLPVKVSYLSQIAIPESFILCWARAKVFSSSWDFECCCADAAGDSWSRAAPELVVPSPDQLIFLIVSSLKIAALTTFFPMKKTVPAGLSCCIQNGRILVRLLWKKSHPRPKTPSKTKTHNSKPPQRTPEPNQERSARVIWHSWEKRKCVMDTVKDLLIQEPQFSV